MILKKKTEDINDLKTKLQMLVKESNNPELNALLEALFSQIDDLNDQYEHLLNLFIQMKKNKFGKKSEGVAAEQLNLFQEMVASLPVNPPVKSEGTASKKQINGGGRQVLPDDLPREEVVLVVAESDRTCEECGTEKSLIGYETSECLEYIPAQLKVIQYKREKLVCKSCDTGPVTAAPADKLIEKGIPGPGLMAEIFVSKYQDHLPLYRIDQRFERLGYSVPRSSMSDWIQVVTETYLTPLGDLLKERVLSSKVLQTDDTPIRVQDRDHPNNIKMGYYWYYIGDGRDVIVDYTGNRKRAGPGTFLEKRTHGYIQSDGYTGYDHIFASHADLVRVGCWMHCRRYFVQALDNGDRRADDVVSHIKMLYEIETKCRDLPAADRMNIRKSESGPLLDAIKTWCETHRGGINPKSLLGKAIIYAMNHWASLTVFVTDGDIPMDNGAVERAIRPVAVGRKNYLFAGNDRAARNAAVIYSLLACCHLEEVNPWLYFRDILTKLAASWPYSRIDELLPRHWKTLHLPLCDQTLN